MQSSAVQAQQKQRQAQLDIQQAEEKKEKAEEDVKHIEMQLKQKEKEVNDLEQLCMTMERAYSSAMQQINKAVKTEKLIEKQTRRKEEIEKERKRRERIGDMTLIENADDIFKELDEYLDDEQKLFGLEMDGIVLNQQTEKDIKESEQKIQNMRKNQEKDERNRERDVDALMKQKKIQEEEKRGIWPPRRDEQSKIVDRDKQRRKFIKNDQDSMNSSISFNASSISSSESALSKGLDKSDNSLDNSQRSSQSSQSQQQQIKQQNPYQQYPYTSQIHNQPFFDFRKKK
ncbi:MAG: hypothetical protein EZS28_010061 [Streblomastix strix]|uniref:Uncharacterized protein n=1 Tax=Streblomastix strix TaxID=222440 RepID=A0A5J4WIA3_9EUKA|nr:MAG: hypothetical protein EZS28_010061 [Streblomastix strix]